MYVLDDFDKEKQQRPGYFPVNDSWVLPNGLDVGSEGKKQIWEYNYMFNVPVENSNHLNFFTDRLVDCFLTKTVPLYWGCPNIGEFYDEKGIIKFGNENELLYIINNLSPDDYNSRKQSIEFNYNLAQTETQFFTRIEQFLDQLIEINNL